MESGCEPGTSDDITNKPPSTSLGMQLSLNGNVNPRAFQRSGEAINSQTHAVGL